MSDTEVTDISNPSENDGAVSSNDSDNASDAILDDFISRSDSDGPVTDSAKDAQDGTKDGKSTREQQPVGASGKGDAQGQQNQAQGQKSPAGANRGGQDLTLSDGTVVKAGAERRLYDKAVNLQRQVSQLTQNASDTQRQLLQYKTQAETYEKSFGTLKELNLSNSDIEPALRILAAFRQNPGETINFLLTQAKSAGHNVQNIGGAGVDTQAIKAMVQEQMAPIVADRNREQRAQENYRQARQEADNFHARFPDARVHEAEISRMMREDSSLSPDTAYYKLYSFFASKGLDWSVPLQQHAERVAKEQANGSAASGVSMPNGRAGNTNLTEQQPVVAPADSTYEDIIAKAMQDVHS